MIYQISDVSGELIEANDMDSIIYGILDKKGVSELDVDIDREGDTVIIILKEDGWYNGMYTPWEHQIEIIEFETVEQVEAWCHQC